MKERDVHVMRDLVYMPGGSEHTVDVYRPDDDVAKLRKTLLFLHGGNFCRDDKASPRPWKGLFWGGLFLAAPILGEPVIWLSSATDLWAAFLALLWPNLAGADGRATSGDHGTCRPSVGRAQRRDRP